MLLNRHRSVTSPSTKALLHKWRIISSRSQRFISSSGTLSSPKAFPSLIADLAISNSYFVNRDVFMLRCSCCCTISRSCGDPTFFTFTPVQCTVFNLCYLADKFFLTNKLVHSIQKLLLDLKQVHVFLGKIFMFTFLTFLKLISYLTDARVWKRLVKCYPSLASSIALVKQLYRSVVSLTSSRPASRVNRFTTSTASVPEAQDLF